MAFEPQRFIHAANVRLDVPVSVQTSETLTDELRFAFEDATLHAFDEVIEACVKRDVDFLLLSGNVFIEADRSLRARLALLKGVRRLEEFNIHVFVLPGDADPPEAWRSIPELPDNVTVCYSSSPEPMELYLKDQLSTTVSASMWLGEVDDFGIRVISKGGEGIQPFRIGVVSKAKFEEARRMASMAASASDETLTATMQNAVSGEQIDKPGARLEASDDDESTRVWRSIDAEDGEKPRKIADSRRKTIQRSLESLESGPAEAHPSLDPDFIRYTDEMLREGHLNYLALTGELARTTLWRDDGVIHCPGTTQPRSQMEASGGACSLVEVAATGEVRITSVDTSCVDWKHIEVDVKPHTNLSSMLQLMKTRLIELKPNVADRIWAVNWILRGALPVLQELARNDLDVAAAVELDELRHAGRTIRLLHDIRSLPNGWPTGDPPTALSDQFQLFVARAKQLSDESMQALIDGDEDLTIGWKQRLTSLLPSVDPEQILARMRTDGAAWFQPDFGLDGIFPEESDALLSDDTTDASFEDSEELAHPDDLDTSESEEDSDD
jgi:spermidine/putrescine-binding protein